MRAIGRTGFPGSQQREPHCIARQIQLPHPKDHGGG